MASPFDSAGANHEGSDYAPLTTDEYFTGLVTNRNPLRDAMVPYLQRKSYQGGRFDSLWDGLNMEVSAKLTLIKRPGQSLYNSASFPAINRFYDFRTNVDGADVIHVVADTPGAVFDATGPAGKTLIWIKSAGAAKTSFQSVGNTLYFGNGVDQMKWIVSTRSYKALTKYDAGTFINDSNGNIQTAIGGFTAAVTKIAIAADVLTVTLDPTDPNLPSNLNFMVGANLTFAGLTGAAFLNGQTVAIATVSPNASGAFVFTAPFVHANYGPTDDAGTITSGTGITGGVAPAWSTTRGAITVDGGAQWVNKGSQVQKWGTASPTKAPTLTQVPVQSPYNGWQPNTYYSTSLITFPTFGLPTQTQRLIVAGVTGAAEPVWNPGPLGSITVDGTAQWQSVRATRQPNLTAQALGDIAQEFPGLFLCIVAGINGPAPPPFPVGVGSIVTDGGVTWQNIGPNTDWSTIGPTVALTLDQTILDSGGYIQKITASGLSGGTLPAWNEILSGSTVDNAATWTNAGPLAPAGTAASRYAYSFLASVSDTESNLSPRTLFTLQVDSNGQVQGFGSDDQQIDTIAIYRTVQGGSTFIFEDAVPAPAAGSAGVWTFISTASDAALSTNFEIQGAINQLNNPPPAGLTNLTYHMGRLWGSVGNLEYFCTGPDATVGDGNEAWSPSNIFALPDSIARSVPFDLPGGVLLVFTAGSPFAIWGTGTANDPFYDKPFGQGSGLLSYDALEVNGSWVSMFTTDMRLLSFQPNSNYTQGNPGSDDLGAPIGDQFVKVTTGGIALKLYTPAGTFVTWHSAGTDDTGLIVADGNEGWFRMTPITAPESGFLWCPRAAIAGGTSAVQSVETAPGIKTLLVGGRPKAVVAIIDVTLTLGFVAFHFVGTQIFAGDQLEIAGMTAFPYLNGLTLTVGFAVAGLAMGHVNHADFPDVAITPDTGTLTLGSPILKRDPTVNSDNGTNYADAYSTIGTIQLCQPTEVAEVAEIVLDSMKVGTAPTVGLLLDEIKPTVEKDFTMLERTGQDPPLLPPSETTFNDRFSTMQNGKPTECRHMQLKIQLSVEDQPNEILTHTIYGRRKAERKQPAQ